MSGLYQFNMQGMRVNHYPTIFTQLMDHQCLSHNLSTPQLKSLYIYIQFHGPSDFWIAKNVTSPNIVSSTTSAMCIMNKIASNIRTYVCHRTKYNPPPIDVIPIAIDMKQANLRSVKFPFMPEKKHSNNFFAIVLLVTVNTHATMIRSEFILFTLFVGPLRWHPNVQPWMLSDYLIDCTCNSNELLTRPENIKNTHSWDGTK